MPSDETLARVRGALAPPLERFQSALATAVEQVRAYLATHRPQVGTQDANGRAALGSFAAGRIDTARFAALLSEEPRVDVDTLARVERAFDTLLGMARRKDELTRVDVEPGGDLRAAVGRALGGIGQAFGAARVAGLSRSGRYSEERHDSLLDALPFALWNPGERELAPPLVVHVDGGDLHAGGLADFLDGGLKIVLVVRGASPPAPLVRLISPGAFVLQTGESRGAGDDTDGLERFGAWEGPGVAAILPDETARFVHDPAGGSDLAGRLAVVSLPEAEPASALGQVSARQQAEDLHQLRDLSQLRAVSESPAARPVETVPGAAAGAGAAGAAGTAAVAADPVGKLAAWLLAQAEPSEAG